MSHYAWMEIDSGDPEYPVVVAEIGNYTRNVSPMWRKAMTAAAGRPMAIQDTDGMTGAEALPLLTGAWVHMDLNWKEYESMNPENGWGDYEGAKEFMRDCLWTCTKYPKAVIRWSV